MSLRISRKSFFSETYFRVESHWCRMKRLTSMSADERLNSSRIPSYVSRATSTFSLSALMLASRWFRTRSETVKSLPRVFRVSKMM